MRLISLLMIYSTWYVMMKSFFSQMLTKLPSLSSSFWLRSVSRLTSITCSLLSRGYTMSYMYRRTRSKMHANLKTE